MARFFSLRGSLGHFFEFPNRIPIRANRKRPTCQPALECLEDRLAPATVQFATGGETLLDNAGAFNIPVTLSAAVNHAVTVPFTVSGGTGTDYSGLTVSPLVIPAGHTSAAITGTLLNDGVPAGLKNLDFTLGTPIGATLGGDFDYDLEIAESHANPTTLSIADASQIEPAQGGTVNMNFTVTRTGVLSSQLTVGYTTVNGTAHGGSDFTPSTGTTTFASGSATATISIPILGAGVVHHPSVTFSVKLTGIVGVNGADGPNFLPPTVIADPGSPIAVAVGDLNGDGKPDLVVTDNGNSGAAVKIFLNTTASGSATPTFSAPVSYPITVGSPDYVALADINGDGKQDLIVAGEFIYVFMNTMATGATTPTFAAPVRFTPGLNASTQTVAVGDLNGDGKPDIVTTGFNNVISVLMNTTPTGAMTPSFAPDEQFAAGETPESIALADFNGDGKLDLVVANDESQDVSVLLNTTPVGATTASFAPHVDFAVGGYPFSLAVGDLNQDGKPDLVIAYRAISDSGAILVNTTPTGASIPSFAPPEEIDLAAQSEQVIVGDFNGDGKLDVAAIGTDSGEESPDIVSVLLNTTAAGAASVTLQPPQEFEGPQYSYTLAAGDFNGVGMDGIVAAGGASNDLSFLMNSPGFIGVGTATGTIASTIGPASTAKSMIASAAGFASVGGRTTVTLQSEDANGINEISGGQTVVFGLANGSTIGTFSSTTDNSDGTYSAVFTGATLGQATITATINGQAVTSSPTTISVTPGAVSPAQSIVTVGAPTTSVASEININLRAKDANGNDDVTGGQSVAFALGAGTSTGVIGQTIDYGYGYYGAYLTGITPGTATTITATINGVPVTTTLPTVTVTPGAISLSQSVVSVSAATIQAGVGNLTVTLTAEDANGVPLTSGGLNVAFALGDGTSSGEMDANATDQGNGTYTTTFHGLLAGTPRTITAFVNGAPLLSALPTITVTPAPVSPFQSYVTAAASSIPAGSSTKVTLQAIDSVGNAQTTGGQIVTFALSGGSAGGTFSSVIDNGDGTYSATFTGAVTGTYGITATINGQNVGTTLPTITVTPGPPPSLSLSTLSVAPSSIASGSATTVTLQAKYANGSDFIIGGLTVRFALGSGSATGVFGPVTDNHDGTYTASITGVLVGSNAITATINGQSVTSTPPTIAVTPGPVSLALSTVSVSAAIVPMGGTAAVTLQAKDANGNNETTGGLTVDFALGAGPTIGSFGTVTDQDDGAYSATFTAGASDGSNTVAATIGGLAVTATPPSLTVSTPLVLDHFSVTVGNSSATVTAVDAFNNAATTFAGSVHVDSANNASAPINYTFSPATDAGQHAFSLSTTGGVTVTNLTTLSGATPANVAVQADINLAAGQYAGLVTHYSGPTDQNMYFGGVVPNPSGPGFVAAIWVNNAGRWTLLTGYYPVFAKGTLIFQAVGPSLQLFFKPTGFNGAAYGVAAANDSSLTGGTVGVRLGRGATMSNITSTAIATADATLPFSENFGAANYPLTNGSGISDLWQIQVGAAAVFNGVAVGRTTLVNLATLNGVNVADAYAQAVVSVGPSGQSAGLVLRYQGTGNQNMYWGAIQWNGSHFEAGIWINRKGVLTLLAPLTPISAPPPYNFLQGTLLFEAVGSSLRLFWQPSGVNGFSLVASATNSTFMTGAVGFRISGNAMLASFNADVASLPTPQNATLAFAEDFTSPSYPSSLGSQLSSYWQNQVGNLSIVNSNATSRAALNVATLNGVNQADVTVQATVNVAKGEFAGLVSRYSGAGDRNMYFAEIASSGVGYVASIWINVNGVWTRLTPLTSIGKVGQGTLQFTTVGSSLQLFWNGAPIVSVTNTRLATGSVGMRSGPGATLANFSAS